MSSFASFVFQSRARIKHGDSSFQSERSGVRVTAKTVIRWVLVLALVAGGAWYYLRGKPKTQDGALHFETTKLERGRIVAKVTANGTLSSLVTVQVGSQVSGRLQDIFVDFNSTVKKGQVLARIDPQLFIASREQARANNVAARSDLIAAKVRALDAQRQYTRAKSLAERKLVAQADLDTAQANAEAAQATVESAQGKVEQTHAALHLAEVNLAYTTINSPIDGIVVSRNVDVGQTVAASLSAPTLFVIAEDLRKMQVDTSVAEADIGKLKPGMPVVFTVDAYPTDRFKGNVRQIRNAPQTVQNVVTYDAVIDVENPEWKLKPGMTANVSFVYADKSDVLRVPNAALRFRPPPEMVGKPKPAATAETETRGKRKVWRLRGTTPEPVMITSGASDGTVTEVVGDELHEGDLVVTDATSAGGSAGGPSGGPSGGPPGGGMRRLF